MLLSDLNRTRKALRAQLTTGERIAAYSYTLLCLLLPPLAVGLLASGGETPIGIGLLLLALIMLAIPISPILKARVRKRQGAAPRR